MKIEIKKDTKLIPAQKHWQFCAGSPHASYALRRDYYEQLKQAHEELGIERVRFHGIFCDDMHTVHKLSDMFPVPGGKEYTETSYRYCGVAYDTLLAAGVKPFVELGFMPPHLAKKPKKRGMFFYKPNISMPKDDKAWQDYIKGFVNFLIDRYGKEEVESWYFEVWNEPDLRMPFFDGTRKDYFHLYEITCKAIKEVDDEIKVGGPSTSGSKWVKELVEYCEKKNIPLDFVTTHQYSGDPLGGIEDNEGNNGPSMNFNIMALKDKKNPIPKNEALTGFRTFMGSYNVNSQFSRKILPVNAAKAKEDASGRPLFYTEWNLCATFSAPVNDTRMVAAYDLRTALVTEGVIDGSSIWTFTDLFEELHPFPEEFHGGFGMMTQSGIPKPVYHALKLVNEAGSERYDIPAEEGNICAAVYKKENCLRASIINLNFKFDGTAPVPVTLSIESDEAPKSVCIRKIDEDHANPYKVWQEMGSPQVPNPTQIAKIKELSAVVAEDIEYKYENGVVTVETALCDNDLHFIDIEF